MNLQWRSLMEPTNIEPTDRYKIMIKAVSKKPKENVQRNWYKSSKIKITKISCGIWVKSGKARCILMHLLETTKAIEKWSKSPETFYKSHMTTKFDTFRHQFHTDASCNYQTYTNCIFDYVDDADQCFRGS